MLANICHRTDVVFINVDMSELLRVLTTLFIYYVLALLSSVQNHLHVVVGVICHKYSD